MLVKMLVHKDSLGILFKQVDGSLAKTLAENLHGLKVLLICVYDFYLQILQRHTWSYSSI